jgi:cellulose synthase (UDP-forming)
MSDRLTTTHVLTGHQRFYYWLLVLTGVALLALFGGWWFQAPHVPSNFHGWPHFLDFVLFATLSFIIWHQIFMDLLLWAMGAKATRSTAPLPKRGWRVAFVTTFVPTSEPFEMLEQTLGGMIAVDYPHDTWVLDEGNDPRVSALCYRYGAGHFSRNQLARYNTIDGRFAARTKGGNHNAWYNAVGHDYDLVAQIDTDFIPKQNFLTRTLGYFNDPRIAFVGTPQIYGNTDKSLIAKGAAEQSYGFYGPIMRGFSGHSSSLLIGANHVIRIQALKDIGFYRAHLTEDLLTGMTFHSKGWKSVYVPEVLAVGEGPTTWDAYFNQQMRWAFGCIDILFKHTRKLVRTMGRSQAIHYLVLQQHYFSGLTLAAANLLLTLYFFTGISASSLDLAPLLGIYLPVALWQLLLATWLQRLNVDPQNERGLLLAGKFVSTAAWPIYFLAFFGVITGKRLNYKVTPKGSHQSASQLSAFAPHLAFGTLTAIGIAVSFWTHHQAPVMLFWAVLNTALMYSVVGHGIWQHLRGIKLLPWRRASNRLPAN